MRFLRKCPAVRLPVIVAAFAIFVPYSSAKIAHVSVDGHPAEQVRVSLFDCKTNKLEAGPLTTNQNGDVDLASAPAGDLCLKATIPSGVASSTIHLDSGTQPIDVKLVENIPRISLVQRVLPLIFCLFTMLLVVYPIARYLAKPWSFRRELLIGQLGGASMKLYYQQFRRGRLIKGKPVGDKSLVCTDYTDAFRVDFNTWYGRRYYITPFAGLIILASTCVWWGTESLWNWAAGLDTLTSMHGLVAASIAGAFTWIISDEIDRLRRKDFTSSDVYYYIFRLLLSIPFGWSITHFNLSLDVGIPIAFFLGAFPTSTLFTIARRFASQWLKLGDDPDSGKLELESLQSVGKVIAERFKDEGISTIVQLAYADPLDLTIRCNFDFNYIVDCISQSLLWIYFGDKFSLLQVYSLRGAMETSYLYKCLTNKDPNLPYVAHFPEATATLNGIVNAFNQSSPDIPLTQAAAALTAAAANLNAAAQPGGPQQNAPAQSLLFDSQSVLMTISQVAGDPYTGFLVEIWN